MATVVNNILRQSLLQGVSRTLDTVQGVAYQSTAALAANQKYQADLESIKQAGTWKTERVITSTQDVSVQVSGSKVNNNELWLVDPNKYCALIGQYRQTTFLRVQSWTSVLTTISDSPAILRLFKLLLMLSRLMELVFPQSGEQWYNLWLVDKHNY